MIFLTHLKNSGLKILISGILVYGCCFCTQKYRADSMEVTISNFKSARKVIKTESLGVIMYFNQKDYLTGVSAKDTIVIEYENFYKQGMSLLLRQGKVKINRLDGSSVTEFTHYKNESGSLIFELMDGEIFFTTFGDHELDGSNESQTSDFTFDEIHPLKKEYVYKEEFASFKDKNPVRIKDYFPLKPGKHFAYNNNQNNEIETIACKSVVVENQEVFYFAEHKKNDRFVMVDRMGGPGLFFYRNGTLFAVEGTFEDEIVKKSSVANAVKFLPETMTPGDSISYRMGEQEKVITFLKREDLQIGNMKYRNCIKLKMIERWPETSYISYLWLKKDLGVVKWMVGNGFIKELKNSF